MLTKIQKPSKAYNTNGLDSRKGPTMNGVNNENTPAKKNSNDPTRLDNLKYRSVNARIAGHIAEKP